MQYREATVRDPDVEDKLILLLGGSGGIGKEIARLLRERGAEVVAPTRTEVDLEASELPAALFNRSWNCIIHCAGVIGSGMELADYERIMSVNFRSAVLVADLAERTMKEGGNVVYVGSSSAMKGRAKFPLYSASKAALNNFTESTAERYQPNNIRVNCVNPAQTLTDMLADVNLSADHTRALSVEHVARVIISYCDTQQTGQIVNIRKNVDGAV
jgi:2-C-methyl-D-erythritol 4-phosphate cytidylyltransferase